MRYLIINADDFGYSFSVNKGIIEAHTDGVVTSTTVLVDAIAAEEAAKLTQYKDLSVGLHFFPDDLDKAGEELERQVEKFESFLGRKPDHIDTHKMEPTDDERVEKVLREYSQEHRTPIRGFGVKWISSFYGTGEQKEELVSVNELKSAIDEATEEYNEVMCHVGYSDDYLREKSSYNDNREKELATIKSPEIREYIESKEDLELCNWNLVREQRF
ncbi:MAG: ChbG/HpnK family deacetylase [Patescibacteria group bacterium]